MDDANMNTEWLTGIMQIGTIDDADGNNRWWKMKQWMMYKLEKWLMKMGKTSKHTG